ncbi:YqgE/AlgH family protein, partial [Aeromonas molluscorum]
MQTLQNHFLLAMPSLKDPYFERALVYLCEHSPEGAMGLVVNIPVDMALDTML